MGSAPRNEPDGATTPWAADQTFTSQAYAAANDEEATKAASEWLEQQSMHPFIRDVAARSLDRLGIAEGEAALEVGCGTGVFLPGLAARIWFREAARPGWPSMGKSSGLGTMRCWSKAHRRRATRWPRAAACWWRSTRV